MKTVMEAIPLSCCCCDRAVVVGLTRQEPGSPRVFCFAPGQQTTSGANVVGVSEGERFTCIECFTEALA